MIQFLRMNLMFVVGVKKHVHKEGEYFVFPAGYYRETVDNKMDITMHFQDTNPEGDDVRYFEADLFHETIVDLHGNGAIIVNLGPCEPAGY